MKYFKEGDSIITDAGRVFHFLKPVEVGDKKMYTVPVEEEKTGTKYFIKYVENPDKKEKADRANIVNLDREAKFVFYYPYIERVYERFDGIDPYGNKITGICVEYIDGKNLREYRETLQDEIDNGNISESAAEKIIFRQIYEFIHGVSYYIHFASPNFLQRDIKPENIMITKDGHVKIIDFDFAYISGSTDTMRVYNNYHELGFSRGYGDPKVLKCIANEETEIYSIGRLLFYWINGAPYFTPEEEEGPIEDEKYISKTAYWHPDNMKLAYGMETARFENVKYQTAEYIELVTLLKRMCCRERKDAYKKINEIKEDFKRFLLKYSGYSEDTFNRYFKLPVLEMPVESDLSKYPFVGYEINEGTLNGNRLRKYSMRDIFDDNKRLLLTACNLENEIYIFTSERERLIINNRLIEDDELCKLENGDKVQINNTTIKFTIRN